MFDLKNKTAIITGGGSGIGKAISILFAKHGAEVHVLELNISLAQATVDEIISNNGKAHAHACNVADHSSVKDIFEKIKIVNILVNNAGIAHVGNLENTSESDFDKIFSVNVKGVYNCLSQAVPKMKAHENGVILNMASIASLVGIPDRFAYSMSKGAVKSITQSVARDYVKYGIRCNCISPARVHTPFVDGFISKKLPRERSRNV